MLAHLLLAPSLDFLLECKHKLLKASFLHKALLGQMLLKHLCSLVGVEGFDLSFFHHNFYHGFQVLKFSTISPNTSATMFTKTSSRVRELGFGMVWLLEKFENGRARKFENENFSKCSFYRWVALIVMSRHWSFDVATLT